MILSRLFFINRFSIYVILVSLLCMNIYCGTPSQKLEYETNNAGTQIQKYSIAYDRSNRRLRQQGRRDKQGLRQKEIALLELSSTFSAFTRGYLDDDVIHQALAIMYEKGDIAKIVEAFFAVAEAMRVALNNYEEESMSVFGDDNKYLPLLEEDWKSSFVDESERSFISLDNSDSAHAKLKRQRKKRTERFCAQFNIGTRVSVERI